MKASNFLFAAVAICSFFMSCTKDKDDDCRSPVCDRLVVVDGDQYLTAPDDQLTIISVELAGDCLKINFASSGCSGSSWKVKLIDSEAVLYSDPPQRNLRLSLNNQEMCDAYIGKEVTFDIKRLRVNGNRVLLNITNSGSQILYEY
ncbi:hypothetical protein [Gaoshiqia sp. Z1-71]|uniref:hypothetical protein n=1 Tax=Gaoshiqia hydrogeniformans TaxID=3290090 RepID=UPI003BF79C6E